MVRIERKDCTFQQRLTPSSFAYAQSFGRALASSWQEFLMISEKEKLGFGVRNESITKESRLTGGDFILRQLKGKESLRKYSYSCEVRL